MLPAVVGSQATPLTGDAAAAGLSVAGLRLVDGSLVLKLECAGTAVQLMIEPGSGFGPGDGVLAQHDLLADLRAFLVVRGARLEAAGDRVAAVVQDPVLPLPRTAGRGFPGDDAIREYSRNVLSAPIDIFNAYQARIWGLY